ERRGYRGPHAGVFSDFISVDFPSSSAAVADSVASDSPKPEGFLVHLAGHVLLFERRTAPDFNTSVGMRLLTIAIVVEALRLVAVKGLTRRFASPRPVRPMADTANPSVGRRRPKNSDIAVLIYVIHVYQAKSIGG